MTREREALTMALAALETCVVYSPGTRFQIKNFDEVSITKSIKAIKETLAQPSDSVEQEPVGKLKPCQEGWFADIDNPPPIDTEHETLALYTAPPKREWVGLDTPDLTKAIEHYEPQSEGEDAGFRDGFKAANDMLKGLNT